MVGPIAAALGRKIGIPRFDRPLHAAVARHVGEIDQGGGAAEQRGPADLIDTLRVEHRTVGHHEGMLHMHMRIYATRHHDLARGRDHAQRIAVCERLGRRQRGNALALDGNVAAHNALRRHHVTAAYDQIEHGCPSWDFAQVCTTPARRKSPKLGGGTSRRQGNGRIGRSPLRLGMPTLIGGSRYRLPKAPGTG